MLRVAVIAASKTCCALNEPFRDPTTESGLTASAEEDVRALSGSDAEFVILRSGEDGYGVRAMLYTKNGYTAVYGISDEDSGEGSWTVYTAGRIIG